MGMLLANEGSNNQNYDALTSTWLFFLKGIYAQFPLAGIE